jgi:hypothetical protein
MEMGHMGARLFALVTVASLVVGQSALADDSKPEPKTSASFEQALESAEPIGDLAERLDPLFAECKRDDDLQARRCIAIRDLMVDRLKSTTWVALGDEASLGWTPWTSGEKQLGLELHGCLACAKPMMADGSSQPRFVTTRVPKAIKGGKAVGLDLGFYGVTLPDQQTAARFVKQTVPRLATQFVFKIGPLWKSGSGDKVYEGVTFVPVAQRVFDRCSGKVYASEPPSQKPAEPQPDGRCPQVQKNAPVVDATLPEQLSRGEVVKAMRSIEEKVRGCYLKFKRPGTVNARMVVDGASGLQSVEMGPPFEGTPTGECVKAAISTVPFGKFVGERMTIVYPFMLR